MNDWNDDMDFTDDEEDEEIGGRFYTPEEEDDTNTNSVASFSFESPDPVSKEKNKSNKETKVNKNTKQTNTNSNNINITNKEITDLRTRSIVPPALSSSNEKYCKRCYMLKESTLKKLIILTATEESLYFNVSCIVDAAINYYYENTINKH